MQNFYKAIRVMQKSLRWGREFHLFCSGMEFIKNMITEHKTQMNYSNRKQNCWWPKLFLIASIRIINIKYGRDLRDHLTQIKVVFFFFCSFLWLLIVNKTGDHGISNWQEYNWFLLLLELVFGTWSPYFSLNSYI